MASGSSRSTEFSFPVPACALRVTARLRLRLPGFEALHNSATNATELPSRRSKGLISIESPHKIPLDQAAGALSEFWSQVVVGRANGQLLKVAKGIGETNWHSHDDQDETFLVLSGTL